MKDYDEPGPSSYLSSHDIISRPTSGRLKSSLSDRLDLDHRGLDKMPHFGQDEEMLKLVNMQHNQIKSIDGIQVLSRLVFLDLYDNKIEDTKVAFF